MTHEQMQQAARSATIEWCEHAHPALVGIISRHFAPLCEHVGESTEMVGEVAAAEPQVGKAWYTCGLVWSQKLREQAYEFKCVTCGKVDHRPSRKGFDPAPRCPHCQEAVPAAEPQVIRKTVWIDASDEPFWIGWNKPYWHPERGNAIEIPLVSRDGSKTWQLDDTAKDAEIARLTAEVARLREFEPMLLGDSTPTELLARLATAVDALNEIIGHGYTWPSTDPKSEDWRQGYSRGVSSVKSIARDALAALDAAKEAK